MEIGYLKLVLLDYSKTMGNKIINIEKAVKVSQQLQAKGKNIVLVGGCFDILHIGHIIFLEKAKAEGDALFVFLESDESIKKLKGHNRPINNQDDRAKLLAALESVDVVILLRPDLKDNDYDEMIKDLKPKIIAVTHGDKNKIHKERQAKKYKSRLVEVTNIVTDQSTSRLVKLLGNDL